MKSVMVTEYAAVMRCAAFAGGAVSAVGRAAAVVRLAAGMMHRRAEMGPGTGSTVNGSIAHGSTVNGRNGQQEERSRYA